MADKPWKAEERRVAKMFGTSRALMKGTDEKSDIISDLFMVDAKLWEKWSINRWYRELRAAARKCDKIPILSVRQPGKKLRLAVVDMDYLVSILNWTLNKMTTGNTKMIASQGRWSRFLSSFLTVGSNYKGSLWDLFRGLRKMVIRSNPRIIRPGFRSETPEATRMRL